MCVRLGCVEPELPCQSPKTLFLLPPYLFIPPVPATPAPQQSSPEESDHSISYSNQ